MQIKDSSSSKKYSNNNINNIQLKIRGTPSTTSMLRKTGERQAKKNGPYFTKAKLDVPACRSCMLVTLYIIYAINQ